MNRSMGRAVRCLVVAVALAGAQAIQLVTVPTDAIAQTAKSKKKPKPPVEKPEAPAAAVPREAPAAVQPPPVPLPPERVEADVSTRTIAITSGYSGSEILIFGAIEFSRQPSAESGFYDVVVVVEGAPEPLDVRQKGRVAGLWVNTKSFSFNAVPSYYAVASTRPIEEFADTSVLEENGIGLEAVRMAAAADSAVRVSSEDLIGYKEAVTRLKAQQGLFKRDDYGVVFTGRSLFRSKIDLPATVPVGPLTARVYLFHEGALLSRYQSRVVLEREGIERWLYAFAFERPFLYGIVAVLLALMTGLIASALFHRRSA
jgi:uncharacterized protein (TIGR02186 family)